MTEPRQAQLPLLLSISEGLSRGTDEMLRVSPQGDAIHPPSCSLAIREAVEEIEWLRAKNKSLFEEVERIDDLFLSREKTLFTQRREIERLRADNEKLTRQRDEARAEIERQARHIEELREKIDAEGSCACSLDAPGDICAAHSPALMRARAEVERLRAEKEALYASIAGIERAAAGAIYSQESIHAMALYALKPLMERGIEPAEAKP